jgi:cell surface protein SprA
MSPEEYRKYEYDRAIKDYWNQRISGREESFRSNLIPQLEVGGEAFDKIFGSNTINIVPQGSAELIFGVNISHIENNTLSEKLRTTPTFDFEEKIQMNVTGTIGEKMELGINYNTDALFDFENRTKLQYAGDEDEIFKKIEAGDVTLPLKGSLINGSYSLFGLKTEMQFGKLTVTTVLSQQKGESSVVQTVGGAQQQEFEISVSDYEANRHFFLSQYFRDIYDKALKTLPTISSGVNIEKIEVWVTNKTSSYDNARNIVAFMDLAENSDHIYNSVPEFQSTGAQNAPSNVTNGLYESLNSVYSGIRNVDQVTNVLSVLGSSFQIGRDYEKIENARKLNPTEYTLNKQMGYISLNGALNSDEVLAVAFQYTLNGEVYQVGEFSTDGIDAPKTLVVKLIKGTSLSPKYPTWDLMMKNVYSLGSGQVDQSDFVMNILYEDAKSGNSINYLPEGNLQDKILLQVLGLDNLNSNGDWKSDGVFDFIDGITVAPSRGRIIFPVVEPFGSYLASQITSDALAKKYVFQELYDSTQTRAKQIAEKDKFLLSGSFTSQSGSEIYLNTMNIAKGSVVVTAGGVTLTENVDYTVDYNMGSVTVINSSLLESRTPISVSVESEQYLGYQTKTLLGTHLNYKYSNDLEIGATLLHLSEKPYTQKVVYGEEPISNTIWGLDMSYRTESTLITNLIDNIPLIETKAPSSLSFFGEFAQLLPGQSKAIDDNAYIDDFESSEIPLDLRSYSAWSLASIPHGQSRLFPEASLNNDLMSGFNRAKLAWFVIDPLFLRNGSTTPDNIKRNPDLQSSHFVREIYENEIFPNRESATGFNTTITVLNLAYYPEEKGPYNYDTEPSIYSGGIGPRGTLNDPASRWGGIMREVLTTDFETSNIQYIEFWLMDPFVENTDHLGGDFYINLGDISEDVLKDSRKSFENGLPTNTEIVNVDTTSWGRVPSVQSVVDAFDNDSESRLYQDVGFDGLMNSEELTFFTDYLQSAQAIVDPDVYGNIVEDPSSDDFHYYRGTDYDIYDLGILERYKEFNGLERNSPTPEMSDESYSTSGTTIPDMEDIDNDNTLNETEAYYQYRISMRPQDMAVGSNYIVDEIEYEATFANGEKSPVTWYQFRIPISEYERSVGAISDFKSIRFMRMFLTDFEEPLFMRFAELNLVRAEWRKYNVTSFEGGERVTVPEMDDGSFEIGSVNIEDNSGKTPVNYVLPPGVDRVIDPTNTQLVQLNEQAMVLKVQDLADGDGRAAYKTMSLDMRKYRKLKMDVHAEALTGQTLGDDDLSVFIRIGSDYKNNFYEYEIPVKVTPSGFYNNDSESDRLIVWPEENRFEIDLSILQEVKQERNQAMKIEGSTLSLTDVYTTVTGSGRRVSVTGNPTLSNVKIILIGVRNPIQTRNNGNDDGFSKSGEIWVNELCLSDFNNEGGWAANAQLQASLADLATVNLAAQASTPGWGSIDSKVDERSMEQVMKYDLSSTVELGKFFPEGFIRLPVYVGYSETEVIPEYNPLDPDVYLDDVLDKTTNRSERDSIKNITTEYTQRKSINISNAGITKRGEKTYPWSPSNISVNYTYNEIYNSNATTEKDVEKSYKGSINYNYDPNPKNIVPFKNVNFLNAPAFRIIKDINFYPLPRNISYRTELYRYYNEVITRNILNPYLLVTPTYDKEFAMSRIFDLKYDVTKQLKVDFSSTNMATIDEPFGAVDKKLYESEYDYWKDSVMVNLKNFGRTTNYYHNFNATYTLPINKIPLLTWINANARFSSDYSWEAGTLYPDDMGIDIGNTIENSSDLTMTAMANLATLYTKSSFLKNIENNTRPGASANIQREYKTEVFALKNVTLRSGTVRRISHNLRTEDITITVTDSEGGVVEGEMEVLNENRISFTPNRDAQGVQIVVEGQVPVSRGPFVVMGEYFVRALMGVRSVSLTLTSSSGQLLPGYLPGTDFMGSSTYNNFTSPGIPFILGLADKDFFDNAVARGLITTDTLQTIAASMKNQINISARSSVEPFPGLKIDLTADRKFNEINSAYYIADRLGNFPESTRNRTLTGAFSMSVISWGTAFEKLEAKDGYASPTFNAFKENLSVISARRAELRSEVDSEYDPNYDPVTGGTLDGEYKSGYNRTASEVMIPAFLSAYTQTDPANVSLDQFPSALKMMPNWRITFDGLSKFKIIQQYFNSITLSHQYRSTYQIGSYVTNLDFVASSSGMTSARDLQGNFVTKYEINTVTITEQFSPLINIDMNWKNSLSTRFEINRSRTVALIMSSNQVTDSRVKEITFGAGYRFDDVSIVLNTGGRQRALKSDLNLSIDFSIRDNKAIARKLIEDVDQPVSGQTVFAAGLSADYVLSDRFKLQFYADHNFNNPFVATTYATSNTSFGFSLQFTLVQ